jgi:hypothetical protein
MKALGAFERRESLAQQGVTSERTSIFSNTAIRTGKITQFMTLFRHFTEKNYGKQLQTLDTALHNHGFTPHPFSGIFQSIQFAMRFG